MTIVTLPTGLSHADRRVAAIVEYFEQITLVALERLGTVYAPDARFKDPFNEVQGLDAIRRIYAHMFASLQAPHFVVHEVTVEGHTCWLGWDFVFHSPRLGAGEQCIRGATLLRLGEDGRIVLHRDYWDAAEQFYEKLPLIGPVLRWLRRRLATP
jgi:limonene-1,2-epoxide hydrolase